MPTHLAALEHTVNERRAALVIIDPLMAALTGGVDSHRDQDVRCALAPLAKLAERTGAAVFVIRHWNKGRGGQAITAGGGSIAISGAARVVLSVGEAEDDADRRVLAVAKCNLSQKAPSLTYEVVTATNGAPVIEWYGETTVTADDLAATRADLAGEAGSAGKREEAEASLDAWLSDGPLPKTEVVQLGRKQGLSPSTVERAARSLRIVQTREGHGRDHRSMWSLPNRAATHVNDANSTLDVSAPDVSDRDQISTSPPSPYTAARLPNQITHVSTQAVDVSGPFAEAAAVSAGANGAAANVPSLDRITGQCNPMLIEDGAIE